VPSPPLVLVNVATIY